MKKIYYILFAFFFILASCTSESNKESAKEDDTTTIERGQDSIIFTINPENKLKNNKLKKSIPLPLTKEINPSPDEIIDTSDAYGFAPNKERLEKMLIEEFANIDPQEYYLYAQQKFTDGNLMRQKKEKLAKLNRVYKVNYYDSGHLQEKRDNNAILVSLINNSFPDLYPARDSGHKGNQEIIDIKRGVILPTIKSDLNQAVRLIYQSKITEAEEILNQLEKYGFDTDYLMNYNKAFIKYKKGDYLKAIWYAEKSVNLRRDFYLGNLLSGDAYLALGLFEKAYHTYEEALKTKENVVSLERLGYTALMLEKGIQAEKCYQRILDIYSGEGRTNYVAYNALAQAFNKKHETSLKKAKSLRAIQKDWSIPPLIIGWNELIQKHYENAKIAFEESELKGEKLYSTIGKAIAFYCRRDYTSASVIFHQLDARAEFNRLSRHPFLLTIAGFSYANNNDVSAALKKFSRYGELYKKDAQYYLGMSLCAYGRNDYVLAQALLDSTKFQAGSPADYYYLKGLFALRNHKYKDAKSLFVKSLSLEKNLKTLNGLGSALSGLKAYDEALEIFNKGLRINPNDAYLLFNKASAIFNIGKLMYREGSAEKAKDTVKFGCTLLERAIAIEPKFSIELNMGNGYMGIKDSASAMSLYRKVPHLAADVNKAVVYAEFNMFEKARTLLETVKMSNPKLDLAEYNLQSINGHRRKNSEEHYKYYEFSYFEPVYHWNPRIPVLFPEAFEPLVPLGDCKLEFLKVTDG